MKIIDVFKEGLPTGEIGTSLYARLRYVLSVITFLKQRKHPSMRHSLTSRIQCARSFLNVSRILPTSQQMHQMGLTPHCLPLLQYLGRNLALLSRFPLVPKDLRTSPSQALKDMILIMGPKRKSTRPRPGMMLHCQSRLN